MDASRRLPDDVHAAARHHGRRRRIAEHAAALRCQLDRPAVGRRRLCAQPAALILTAGALADRYGRRLLFITGVVLFTRPRSSAASPGASLRSTSRVRCKGSAAPRCSRRRSLSSVTNIAGRSVSERSPSGVRRSARQSPAGPRRRPPDRRLGGAGSSSSTSRSASSSRSPSPVSRSHATKARDIRTYGVLSRSRRRCS